MKPAYTRCEAPRLQYTTCDDCGKSDLEHDKAVWTDDGASYCPSCRSAIARKPLPDPLHAVMAKAFAKIRDKRVEVDMDALRAQIALLSDADCIATFVTELIRRGMLDDMRLAIMDARAERMRDGQ